MLFLAKLIFGFAGLILLTGCSPNDTRYFNGGVGTELAYPNIGSQMQLQQTYVNAICQQVGQTGCGGHWDSFVQAGMNDIDNRCDAYLEWLDTRSRSSGPILQQISDTQGATTSILLASGTGVGPIGIVAAAFGLARNTFYNVNSRLITEVDHSTVQTIVLGAQTRFRTDLKDISITSEPEAIYALRQYLRICMPFTIENQINSTLTTFARGGGKALDESKPLIATNTIGAGPIGGRTIVNSRGLTSKGISSEYASVLVHVKPEYNATYMEGVLAKLCVKPDEAKHVTKLTNSRIRAFQQYLLGQEGDTKVKVTGKLTEREVGIANGEANCKVGSFENYYESFTFDKHGLNDPDLIELLNKHLPDGQKLTTATPIPQIRRGIAAVRKQLPKPLELMDPNLSDQVTWDLMMALGKDP